MYELCYKMILEANKATNSLLFPCTNERANGEKGIFPRLSRQDLIFRTENTTSRTGNLTWNKAVCFLSDIKLPPKKHTISLISEILLT